MTDYDKYIKSSTAWISNSGHDENNRYNSGAAGDQTGLEWQLKKWYPRPWTVVLRHPDKTVQRMLAEFGIDAALNNMIGYDQYQRNTYWNQLQNYGYKPANIKTKCEADCTAGVTANIKAVGKLLGLPELEKLALDTYSGNMKARLVAIGFRALTASKYLSSPDYLLPGDILLYEGHHAATNITRGKYASDSTVQPTEGADGVLKKGDVGAGVKTLQKRLVALGYDIGKYGVDGDFGKDTEKAVKQFQIANKLPLTGKYDKATAAKMEEILERIAYKHVVITGDAVNVRSEPNTSGQIYGVAKKGDKLDYKGDKSTDGWFHVAYKGKDAWVSGKYGRLDA